MFSEDKKLILNKEHKNEKENEWEMLMDVYDINVNQVSYENDKKDEKEYEFEFVLLNLERTLCRGLVRVCEWSGKNCRCFLEEILTIGPFCCYPISF